jgi:flagellum-specific peptidoglycan hydrolase FlgJ
MITPPEVVAAAKASQKRWRIPASVTIAQWRLESGNGVHQPGFNCFGLKCRPGKGDPSQMLMTTEYSKARGYYKVPQAFRKFDSLAASFDAHSELIATAKVYAPAMAKLPDRDKFIDLMGARYATDPLYASKLKTMIRQSNLGAYDQ